MESTSSGRLLEMDFKSEPSLRNLGVWELGCALLDRLRNATDHAAYVTNQRHLHLYSALQRALARQTNRPDNRHSPHHLAGVFGFVHHCVQHHGVPLRGATYLDVGCGALNPYGRMFAHLMAGAARAGCLELDPIRDPAEALQLLADIAVAALLDPSTVFAKYPITGRECLANIADFDLGKLAKGDPGGLNAERLIYLQRSASDTGLPEGIVDVVVSNSVLEHVPDPGATLAELARITRPGGFAMHGIDVRDHRWYADPKLDPLEFLTIASTAKIVHECNRLRLTDFEGLFAVHGFTVLERRLGPPLVVTPVLRARLQEPWRSMPDAVLEPFWGQYLLRRE